MTELSDDLLVAYVDGRLAKDQKRAIARVLDQDDVVAQRAENLKDAHQRLEAAFEAILAGSVQEVMAAVPLAPPAPPRKSRNGLGKLGLATVGIGLALLYLVFGLPGTNTAIAPGESGRVAEERGLPSLTWQERALIAQALLGRESVVLNPESQSNRDLVGFQLARMLGPQVTVPNLEPQGMTFKRGQILKSGEKSMAQLIYLGASGAPVSLYLMQEGGGTPEPVFRKEGAVRSFLWREGNLSHLLAAEAERTTLEPLVTAIRANDPKSSTEGAMVSGQGASNRPEPQTGADNIVTGTN